MPAVVAVVVAETVTASMVFAAVAQVGLGLTVVGAVTGNQTLMKIGGVLGMVGGVGSLATGLANSAAGAATAGAEGLADNAIGATGDLGMNAAGSYAPEGLATTAESAWTPAASAADAASSAVMDGPINYSGTGLADTSGGFVDSGTQQLGAIGDTASIAEQTFPTVGAPEAVGAPAELAAPSAPNAPGMQASIFNPSGGQLPVGYTPPTQSGGWLTDILSKDNRGLLMDGAKLIGGGLQGAEKTRLAEEELKARMGVHEYNKMLKEREQANMNAQPNLSKLRYTPNPNLFVQQQQPVRQFTGLMNATKA